MAINFASARMSQEARFQDAYARFLTDERFRERVRKASTHREPVDGLSDADVGRLLGMDQDRIDLFARCLFVNRMAVVEDAFPLSFKIMGNAVGDLVRALDARHIAIDTRKYAEAVRFADFVLYSDDPVARALSDSVLSLLRYELTMLSLRIRPQLPMWPASAIHSVEALRRALEEDGDAGLVLNNNRALLSVGFDVDLLRDVTTDTVPIEAETEVIVLLYRAEGGVVQQKRLNHASAAAILTIEKARMFRALVGAFATWLGRVPGVELEQELKELCIGLCDCGALCMESLLADPHEGVSSAPGDAA